MPGWALLAWLAACAPHKPPVVLDIRVQGEDRDRRDLALGSDDFASRRRERIRDRSLARAAVREATEHGNTRPWQLIPGMTLVRPKVRLDEAVFAADATRVRDFFVGRGFFTASVSSRVEPHPYGRILPARQARKVALVHEVTPGPRAWVSEVVLRDAPEDLADELGKALTLEPGWYDEPGIDAQREDLRAVLASHGFARATVEAELVELTETWAVHLHCVPGAPTTYGPLFWDAQGNKAVAKLGRTVRADLPEGALWDERALERTRMRLERTAAFTDVDLVVNRSGKGPVPIGITAVEGTGWDVRNLVQAKGQGGMYQLAFGVRFRAHRVGLLRRLAILEGEATGGWGLAPSTLGGSGDTGPTTRHRLQLSIPLIPLRPLFLVTGGQLELDLQQGFHGGGADAWIGLAWAPLPNLTLAVQQRVESRVYVPVGQDQAGRFFEVFQGGAAAGRGPDPDEPFASAYTLSYTQLGAELDLRDDPAQPRRGWWFRVGLAPGLGDLFRQDTEVRAYAPLGDLVSLAGRTRLGVVHVQRETDARFMSTRYQLGGTDDVRGWSWQGLQPPGFDARDNAVQIGGNVLWYGSFEVRLHTHRDLTWTLFTDVGRVWESTEDKFDADGQLLEHGVALEDLQPSLGVGLRSPSPFGPVRIEWAARMRQETGIIGEPHWWQLHLAFGEAF